MKISRVAVIGAGAMGSGIAAHLVGAGLSVLLLDVVPNKLNDNEIKQGLTIEDKKIRNKFAQMGKDRVTNPKSKMKLIYDQSFSNLIQVGNIQDDLSKIKECDWIIEVIVEDLSIKQNLMGKIAKYRKPGSIISTNTSGVSIDEIVKEMTDEFKEHFLGTHFFNPPRYMKLLELIPGKSTSDELMNVMCEFGTKRLGKSIVIAKDTPNFIANRIGVFNTAIVFEAMEKFGLSIPEVDILTGNILGKSKLATFKTGDLVGLDILKHVMKTQAELISDQSEQGLLIVPKFVNDLIKQGNLGKKAGAGFYKTIKENGKRQVYYWNLKTSDYEVLPKIQLPTVNKAKRMPTLSEKLNVMLSSEEKDSKFAWEITKNILLFSARRIPEIADDFKAIDDAMVFGYNWEVGPFKLWDMIGLEKSIQRMKSEGEIIPKWIEDRLNSGMQKFYSDEIVVPYLKLNSKSNRIIIENKDATLIDIGDEIICLEFKSTNNVITTDLVEMINISIDEVEKNYKGLIIGNHSKNFCIGANLKEMSELADKREYELIEEMVKKLQTANMRLKYCKRPVVSAPFGMTLGGGCEVVLHTHASTPAAETYMGLVEMGVGLIPAGGGTKELLFRNSLQSKRQTTAELIKNIVKPFEMITRANTSTSGFEAIKLGFMDDSTNVVMNSDYLIESAKEKALSMYNNGFRPLIQKQIPVAGTKGIGTLKAMINTMLLGNFISEHDALIAEKVAIILSGGYVPSGTLMSEEEILNLEREAFISLVKEGKTVDRMKYMLSNNRPLRN